MCYIVDLVCWRLYLVATVLGDFELEEGVHLLTEKWNDRVTVQDMMLAHFAAAWPSTPALILRVDPHPGASVDWSQKYVRVSGKVA